MRVLRLEPVDPGGMLREFLVELMRRMGHVFLSFESVVERSPHYGRTGRPVLALDQILATA
jgi:hypothetical protein